MISGIACNHFPSGGLFRFWRKKSALVLAFSGLFALPSSASPEEFESTAIGIGVVVKDLEKSLDFYVNVIGMIQTGGFEVNKEFSKKSGLADGHAAQVKVLRLGEGESASQWKLVSFGDAAKAGESGQFVHQGSGMRYIALAFKDLAPVLKRIGEKNIKLLGDTPVPLGQSSHFALVQDPDGTFIELIGPIK